MWKQFVNDKPFPELPIIVRHSVALGAGAWAPISQGCPLKETVYLTAYKTPRPLSSPSWPSLLISSLQRLPERTGRGPGLGFPSAKVKNLPHLSWVPLPPRTSGVIPGRQAAWGWVGRGSPGEWGKSKALGWGQQEHCEVAWGPGRAVGCRCPPLLGLPSPPGHRGSWLQLVPPVSCRHLGRTTDKGTIHQLSSQEPPGEVYKQAPAGSH